MDKLEGFEDDECVLGFVREMRSEMSKMMLKSDEYAGRF